MFKRIVKWLLLLILLVVISLGITLFLAIDAQPSVIQNNQLDSALAQKSKQLLKRTLSVLKQQQDASIITMSQGELNGLSALLHRAIPNVASNITLSNKNMNVAVSVSLPIINRYINIETQILPSQDRLVLNTISIGSLSLSGTFTLRMVRWALNNLVQVNLGDSLLTMIGEVRINKAYCTFTLSLPKNLASLNKEGSLLFALRDELSLFGDPAIISAYYQELVHVSALAPNKASLAYYFRHLFQFAEQRTLAFGQTAAINENKAALLALGLYFGADKFELLVGDISQLDMNNKKLRRKLQSYTLLQGRADLQKHFIYSVALQLFSSVSASDAIGEFKEFIDSNKGGSGFSFADLMADRAGTRLAELATTSQPNAIKVQGLLAHITDETLLPSIDGLPEGLSSKRFEAKYEAIHSQAYQALLLDIDQRLSELALYDLKSL
ncbi:hypothetical protein [Thalassotalea piscium]|uniref:Uncharacterized protein n=1 Tax=Thalassotalea piscium TaxID=1230533 RepID=A0A7X0TSV3_9GAMM|nr:hypothetical protein [Thalassotalea piscium]MBB6542504.1 hypothetical protein [Thalassotalea piscium]